MTLIDAPPQNADGTFPAFAWPGEYPIYYLTSDGETMCPGCVNKEIKAIVAADINWEDTEMTCCNCYKRIESAYGE